MVHDPRSSWGFFSLLLVVAITSTASVDPCPLTVQTFNITTTEQAGDLATALNCSGGGTFDVQWEGTVVVVKTIALTDGSNVTIAGVGSDAIADGGGTAQLFTIRNATLHLTNVGLNNGYGYGGDTDLTYGHGGAIWVGGSESAVFWSGTTTFYNNVAYQGGAVKITDGASVFGAGRTNFTKNDGQGFGGALSLDDGAVLLTGETSFIDNSAVLGGADILASSAKVSCSGVTWFQNSTLPSGWEMAGAVVAISSVLSWRGNTSFIGARGGSGGAVRISSSNISWEGTNVFYDNVAGLYGGAMKIMESSIVSLTGKTSFCNNRANGPSSTGRGGAIEITASKLILNGTTIFTNNSAGMGGAVFAGGISSIVWDGTTTFTKNSAVTGGAFYGDSNLSMGWSGAISFEENTANTNGGAVALATEVFLELGTKRTALSLTGNAASIAGGALYMSAISKGLTWKGVSFVSNTARIGGAVYSIASGTKTELYKEFPSKYAHCVFRNNTAEESGGAIESAAGKDEIVNTTFEANNAGAVGGGLRMAGTTNLTRCDFSGNGAKEAGPAVAAVSTVHVSSSSFEKNGLLCASGSFLNYTVEGSGEKTEEATKKYFYSVCNGCEECSGDCHVNGKGTQQCIPALENTNSLGVDRNGVPIVLETLLILPGYWRPVASTSTVLPCWNKDACDGGVTDDSEDCADGYRGPYCAICTHEYAPSLAYTCSKCSSGEGIGFAILALLAAFVAISAVGIHLLSNVHETKDTGFKRLTQALSSQGLKTVVVAWQILTQFDSVANVTYAGVYGKFLDSVASVVSLDLGLVISAGCMAATDFHDRLFISTLGPLLALAALGLCFIVATRRTRGSPDALQAVRRKHFSMALLVTFVIYSSVSSTLFRAFDCETLDDDQEYLRADYTIKCTSAKHKAIQVYSAFMIMLYPIGIPVLYGIILFMHHDVLHDRRRSSGRQLADVEVTAYLWKPYTPERYYYEVVECVRRVTLTGVVVFIYPNSAAPVAVTLVLAFVFVMVSESLAPYASKKDAWLSRVGHIVVFLSMFQALVLKVDVSDESSDSQEVFAGVLLAANFCMVAVVIAEAMMVILYICRREDNDLAESVAPGLRTTASTRRVVRAWDMIEPDAAATSTGTIS